jgi:hypothetical protein
MAKKHSLVLIDQIEPLILDIRDQKVMLDNDLAALYEVPTKALNQAVKRNLNRFPADFLFQLTANEKAELVTNCDHLAKLRYRCSRSERNPGVQVVDHPVEGGQVDRFDDAHVVERHVQVLVRQRLQLAA